MYSGRQQAPIGCLDDHDALHPRQPAGCRLRALRDALEAFVIDPQLRGAAALGALEDAGRLFAYPSEVAAVLERDLKTVYLGLKREEIPSTRVGQRYQIALAWLRRQAAGVPA
jgi:hypothetical protein